MYRKHARVVVLALIVITIGLLFFCERNNPYDPNSKSFVPGKKPHVAFVNKTMTAFLLDTISIPVLWSDTAVGGAKGAIKTLYIDWHGDTLYHDSIVGTAADTLVLRRAFPVGQITVRIRALDYDGNYSAPDSMKLSVLSSRPKIVTSGGSRTVRKAAVCTLSVSSSDTGGRILTFSWAKNGTDFFDSTSTGSFQVSYADTGAKIVLVKARDNKGVESAIDTFHIAVYDKRGAVFYDGNGNTNGTVPSDTSTYVPGQPVIVLGNTGNLEKSGYVFSGWNTLPNGSGANYSPGAMFSMDTVSAVLYAQWTTNPTFTVAYNGDGNTGGTVPTDTVKYPLGQSVMVLGNTGSLVKSGNAFVGWNTEPNGSGIGYAAGVSFFMGSANVTLYAQWTADPTYTVEYDGNGNSGGTVPVDGNNYLSGATVKILGNTGGLVKTGNTFVGWNTKADGSGTAYASEVSFTMGSASVALFAQWTALPTYTITYDGNGSTGGTAPVDANSYLQGQTVTTHGMGTLFKTGSTFTGWNTKADGTGTGYAAGATFTIATANETLYAQWTLIQTYSVTYNGNGNNAGTVPADNNHYTFGQSVTVLANTGNLAKTGATFVGWNTQANGTGIGYAAAVSFVMGSANVTLYAQWTANPTFTVTYRGNTNSAGTVPVDGNNYLSGATVTVLGNTGGLVKTGNTFIGWNTQADGSGTTYASQATFVMGSTNITLYARWTALPTYTITYDGNVNTGGTPPVDANSYLQGQSVTTRGAGTLVKTGYIFTGWNTRTNGSGTAYAAGVTFAMGAANDTLHAQWLLISTYSVAYNGNTNTAGTAPADNNRYAVGQPVIVLSNTGNLVKPGHTFVGWNTQANDSGIGYAAGVSFVMGSSNVTLYAQWTQLPTYNVTYDGNGSTGGTVPLDGNNYLSGATVSVPDNSGGLVKTGNTFVGWNTKTDGSGTTYTSPATFAMGSANIILYARWTSNPTYKVTYDGNGSLGGNAPADANSYLQGQTVTTLSAGSLTRTNYTFAGWNTQANGGGTGYGVGVTFTMPSNNLILFAQWTGIATYTVTYNGNGNTSGTAPTDNNHYTAGQTVIALGNGSLVDSGHTFVGWNTNANGTGIGYAAGTSFLMGSANDTLFAQWTAKPTYTVTYDGNGSTGGTPPPDENRYLSGATVTVLGNTGVLVKTGNTFVGWNTQTDGNGLTYTSPGTFAMGSANVTLYARWSANQTYKVTYDGGNGSTGGSPPTDANNYLPGATVVVLANTGTLAKSGYTFAGWDTSAAGAGLVYAPGASFAIGSANVTLHAQWTLIATYTVTYSGNGFTGGSVPTDANAYLTGAAVTVIGNTGNLVRTNYTFVGWNTASNGTGASYAGGAILTMGTSNVTLYALWTQNATYTVTYDGNSNSGGSVPTDANAYLTGAAVTVIGNTGNLVRTNYTFVGWNTASNGTGASYAGGAILTMGTSNVTLYALWTQNATYTVTYSGNGFTGGSVPTDANAYLTGAAVTVIGNTGNLVRTNYTFVGWNTASNGTGASYAGGAILTMGTSNVTLYAQWTQNATYTVTYSGNGFTGGSVPTDANAYLTGAAVTVIGNTGNLVRTNYTFVGWNTASNGTGASYAGGAILTMGTSNVTLYAQWTQNATYTVTYSGNGSTSGSVPTDANAYLTGADVTVKSNSGNLVRTNYTFVGWNTASNGTGASYAGGAILTMGTSNVTLYAQWTQNATYTVTYSGNGFTGGSVPTDANAYLTGADVTVKSNSGNLVQTGYTFVGWNTASNGSGASYAGGAILTMGTSNVTLYAQWTQNATYTVTYNGNGSTSGSVPTDANAYLTGADVTVKSNSGNLVRTNYTFVGWNTASNGTGASYAGGAILTMGTSNVTLYAQWTQNATYTVTYNGNGFTGGSVPTDANAYLTGADVTVKSNSGNLVQTGYTFVGWNTASNGSGASYAGGAILTMGTSNVTLYAQWTQNATYTVTYNGNGSTSGSVPTDANAYLTGADVTVKSNSGNLVQTGYTFVGWNTASNGSGASYAGGAILTMGTSNVTLYAQWTAINATYTVTYDGNGFTGGIAPTDGNNYLSGATVTVRNLGTLVRTGCTFAGWNTSADGSGTSYGPGDTFVIGTSNVTLYAQWTVTIIASAGLNGAISPSGSVSVPYNGSQAFTITPNTGYQIATITVDGSPVGSLQSPYTFTSVTAAHTIAASFAIDTFTVTYNGNNNTGGNVPTDPNKYTYGQNVTVLDNTGGLVNNALTFMGWNTQANGLGTTYLATQTIVSISSNMILYAIWQ